MHGLVIDRQQGFDRSLVSAAPRAWDVAGWFLWVALVVASCGPAGAGGAPLQVVGSEADARAALTLGTRGTVLLFLAKDCPIANAYAPELRRIHESYSGRGVAFRRVYPWPEDTPEELAQHGQSYQLAFPAVRDPQRWLARSVGATLTPEAAVLDAHGELVYRGRIDDLYIDYGKRRREPSRRDLRLALDALLEGRAPELARTTGIGCFLPEDSVGEVAAPTFAADVASILHTRCAACHHDGGGAPFPLLTYDDAALRARQIGLVTRSRYMPPWKPDPGTGRFLDTRRLDDQELETIQRWVEAGAPSGDLATAPPPPSFSSDWTLGEPDLVLSTAAIMDEPYEVPAEGLDLWDWFVLPTDLPEDRFVRAVEILPSNTDVVHHVILYPDPTAEARTQRDESGERDGSSAMYAGAGLASTTELTGWVRGVTPRPLPDGHAWRLSAGSDVVLDTHFKLTGRVEHVSFRVGLHFADGPPARPLGMVRLRSVGINLAPGVREHVVTDEFVLPVDAELLAIVPHAHFLAVDVRCDATLPDGEPLPLIRVSDWDFNWHDIYRLEEAVPLPRGTTLSMRIRYDNSDQNPRNPSHPPRRVLGGPGSQNEMAVVWLQVAVRDEADAYALASAVDASHAGEAISALRRQDVRSRDVVRAFDLDGDGSLDPEEERAAVGFLEGLATDEPLLLKGFDEDGDGALSLDERTAYEALRAAWMPGS